MLRVDSVYLIDAQQNPNPFIDKNVVNLTAGKRVQDASFLEYLNMRVSQAKEANVTSLPLQTDHKSVSILMGYYPQTLVSPTPGVKHRVDAYKSPQEL